MRCRHRGRLFHTPRFNRPPTGIDAVVLGHLTREVLCRLHRVWQRRSAAEERIVTDHFPGTRVPPPHATANR